MSRVIVIGAGIGGATVAAILAKEGHDVTVLEAHVYPGGCAGTFFHKGYRFDAGATLAGGFHAGGPHDVVGKMLDIDWNVCRTDPAWHVVLPDRVITRWGDTNKWHEELHNVFADSCDQKSILRFNQSMETVSDAVWGFASKRPAWPPSNLRQLVRTSLAVRPETLSTLPHLFQNTQAWANLSHVHDRAFLAFLDAQLLISAQTTSEHANSLFGAAAYDLPRKGVNHVMGGMGGISTQLIDAVRRYGGQALFRHEVTRLETKNGIVVAALTNKGLRLECDLCIANLMPWDLARLLGDAAPAALQVDMSRRKVQWGAFTLYAGVDAAIQPCNDHIQVVADYGRPLGETNSIFLSFSMRDDTKRAPVGTRALTMSTHTRLADWWELRERADGQSAYEDRVALYTEKMLRNAEEAIPGLRSHIRFLLPGTPVTFRFFTRRYRGAVGGFPFTSLLKARGPWTGIPNTWLVGDSIFPGQSTAGVTMGALRVIDEILQRL